MKELIEQIVDEILIEQVITEDEQPGIIFTPAEEKFLARFGELDNPTMGFLYADNDTGRQEFMSRSGRDFNCTPQILSNLENKGIISVVELPGFSDDANYTLQLNIPIDDVRGFSSGLEKGDKGGDDMPTGGAGPDTSMSSGGGGGFTSTADLGAPVDVGGDDIPAPEGEDMPAPEGEPEPTEELNLGDTPQESFRKDGDLILEQVFPGIYCYKSIMTESANIANRLLETPLKDMKVHSSKSRVLKRLPAGFVFYLEKIINMLSKRLYTDLEREHLVADILDNLAHNFGLTPKQILKSYVFYRSQNRLKNLIKK